MPTIEMSSSFPPLTLGHDPSHMAAELVLTAVLVTSVAPCATPEPHRGATSRPLCHFCAMVGMGETTQRFLSVCPWPICLNIGQRHNVYTAWLPPGVYRLDHRSPSLLGPQNSLKLALQHYHSGNAGSRLPGLKTSLCQL